MRIPTPLGIGVVVIAMLGWAAAFNRGHAQFGGGGNIGVSQAYVDNAVSTMQSTIMAAMPLPANVVPSVDATGGAIGSTTNRYMLQDSVRPARYRAGQCTISGGAGQCTITWSTPFPVTPQPASDPSAINSNWSTLQYNCNWVAPLTTTTGTVGCRSSILGLAILGTIWSALGNTTVVYGTAVQPL